MPVLSSGSRKYTAIWAKVKAEGKCAITCPREDTWTNMNGVKKEKTRDPNKPKNKLLKCIVTKDGVLFKLVEDASINNL